MTRDFTGIPPLPIAARTELYEGAVGSIAAELGKAPSGTTVSNLGSDVFDRPAFIMMAALAAVEGGQDVWSDALHLLDWVMDRQRRLWTLEIGGERELGHAVAQAAALVRLRMGCQDHGEAIRLLQFVPLLSRSSGPTLERVCAALRVHHPGSLYLNPILPDILGDYLVSQELEQEPRLGIIALRIGKAT
jgi:hypothetical protein